MKSNNNRVTLFNENKQRFSLRKLSIGVASVLLGITFLSFNSNSVNADVENDDTISTQVQQNENKVEIKDANTDNQKQEINISQETKKASITDNSVNDTNQKVESEAKLQNTDVSEEKTAIQENKAVVPQKKNVSTDVSVNEKQPERVSVHDPSIFQDPKTGKYYVFGSHQAEAESDDLYNWKPLFKKEYEQPSYIFNNYDKDLKKIFNWAGSHDGDAKNGYAIWAPDEIYNPDYTWKDGSKGAYMYYFATSSSWIHSAIGYAVSKTVHGPYQFEHAVIYSGFTKDKEHNGDSSSKNDIYTNTNLKDLISSGKVDGFSDKWIRPDGTYNNDYAPNAIDVNIVTDKDNNLWMSYGSWSGGIYLLPLNKETGMPIYPGKDSVNKYGQRVDRYFGTHLIGGFHESGEAPYIKYDRKTGYYYLFITYGGLTREGGYNMRLFRSKEINGRYVDAMDQHPEYTEWKTNDTTKQENQKYGIKLEGNYDFSCLPYSYMSPGHNSAFIDKDGNWFLINHTRFNHGTEYHEIRVKPMIMTQNGWPIPLPFEYTGHEEKISDNNIENVIKQIPGNYEFVNNGTATSGVPIARDNIQLNENHQVTGGLNGTWSTEQKGDQIVLTITDQNGHEYLGEFKLQQDESDQHKPVLVFAALGNNNEVIWGEKQFNDSEENENTNHDNNTSNVDIVTPTPSPIIDNSKTVNNTEDKPSISVPEKKTTKALSLMHNAYIYDENGKRISSLHSLKVNTSISLITPAVLINGRKFYRIAGNSKHYIAAGNIEGKLRKLTHNAYIYNNKGKRVNKLGTIKKNTSKATYGSPVKIGKKMYYRVGINQFIKVANFTR